MWLGDDAFALDPPAITCRFHGERIALLGVDSKLRSATSDGKILGNVPLRDGATDIAVTAPGSVVVAFDSPPVLQRFGDAPLEFRHDLLQSASALAVESGAIWVAGPGRALRLRPVPDGLAVLDEVALDLLPLSAAVGPDGALYVVLEPGDRMLRVFAEQSVIELPEPVSDIARGGASLWACGASGVIDLTPLLPAPDDGPQFQLPACD